MMFRKALEGVAKELHICVLPELVMQIEGLDSTPDLGYPYGKELIMRKWRLRLALPGYGGLQ